MLNPAFLGLPDTVEGVPFVQSIVIIHMIITFLLLVYSGREAFLDLKYKEVLRHHAEAHFVMTQKPKNQAIAAYKKVGQGLLDDDMPLDWSVKPDQVAKPSYTIGKAVKRLGSEVAKRSPAMVAETATPPPSPPSEPPLEVAANTPSTKGADLMHKFTQLLYLLPVLLKQRDPTIPPGIWTPFETLNPFGNVGELQEYNKHLVKRKDREVWAIWLTPIAFILAWAVDVLIYFASEDPVESA